MATVPEALALASQHHQAGNFAQAEHIYRQVLQVEPAYPQVYNNLGAALQEQGKLEEAAASYSQAVRYKPDYARAFYNLGYALKELNELDEAVTAFQHAIRLQPDYAVAHWNLAMTWLIQGDFARGWPEYEWRWKCQEFVPRSFHQPRWDGSPLAGRIILLHAEQGLGDSIHFIRYAPLVRDRGGRILVECPAPLIGLLRTCEGVEHVIATGAPLPHFDVHAPLLSLPGIFRTRLDTIPAKVPYLFADPVLVEKWSCEFRQGDKETRRQGDRETGRQGDKESKTPSTASPPHYFAISSLDRPLNIGIVWRGHPLPRSDRQRSIPLRYFDCLGELKGVRLFSLQKGLNAEQLHELTGRVAFADMGSRLAWDFTDTAALVRNLDLIISCDTSVAHLAGALGVSVWIALPFAPDWRWLLEREDSPWYPTMRVFRQGRAGDWENVVERITQEVKKLAKG